MLLLLLFLSISLLHNMNILLLYLLQRPDQYSYRCYKPTLIGNVINKVIIHNKDNNLIIFINIIIT